MLNLLINAIQAADKEFSTLKLRATSRGTRLDYTIIEISDNGCGMDRAFIEKKLFQPFQTTKKSGTGIGLFQSKAIVEAHGGKIEVESEEGQGSTFRVILPLEEDQKPTINDQ